MTKTLIAALLALPLMANAADNLVVNGSFEDTAAAAGVQTQDNGSYGIYSLLPGWSLSSGTGIEVRSNLLGAADDGAAFVELDAESNSSITQTLQTIGGQQYTLSFSYSPRVNLTGPADTNDISVSWNGNLLQTVGGVTGLPNHVWTTYTFNVLALGSDVLSFAAAGTSDSYGGSLDTVSLTTAVPEPGTWALLCAGLLAVCSMVRRRNAR